MNLGNVGSAKGLCIIGRWRTFGTYVRWERLGPWEQTYVGKVEVLGKIGKVEDLGNIMKDEVLGNIHVRFRRHSTFGT